LQARQLRELRGAFEKLKLCRVQFGLRNESNRTRGLGGPAWG
jgi:hypothetical protein